MGNLQAADLLHIASKPNNAKDALDRVLPRRGDAATDARCRARACRWARAFRNALSTLLAGASWCIFCNVELTFKNSIAQKNEPPLHGN